MLTAEHLRDRILAALPGADVDVVDYTGTGDHFRAEVVSDAFEGRSLVERHRMVYAAVRQELADGSIHALSISARTP